MSPAILVLLRFALDVAWKATAVLAAAGILLILLRRASAAIRHVVSTLALAGAIALPVLSLLPLSWDVPLIPDLLPAPVRTRKAIDVAAPHELSDSVLTRAKRPPAPVEPRRSFLWMERGLALWAVGAALSLARLVSGSRRVASMARDAVPLSDLEWTSAAEDLRARMGLSRPVALLASQRVPIAMTCGLRRPLLLVSENADRWPAERRRVVLVHELAHVQRHDWIALMIAEIARAIYWFHPLVWIVVEQARRDCEKACDDVVLKSGTKPSVYAAQLLGIVRALQAARPRLLPAVPMARPSQFEGRLRAILDARRGRRRVSGLEKTMAISGALSLVFTVGAIEPWACPQARRAVATRPASSCSKPAAASKPACAAAARCPRNSARAAPAAARDLSGKLHEGGLQR